MYNSHRRSREEPTWESLNGKPMPQMYHTPIYIGWGGREGEGGVSPDARLTTVAASLLFFDAYSINDMFLLSSPLALRPPLSGRLLVENPSYHPYSGANGLVHAARQCPASLEC